MVKLTAASIVEELRPLGSPAGAAAVLRFMKEPLPCLGLTAPQLKAYAKTLYPVVKQWTPAERNRLCNDLWRCGYHEGGLLVAYLYRRFRRSCGSCEFKLFERWMERDAMSWAHVDGVSMWLIAAAVANEPALVPQLVEWTASKGRWKRRAAAVGLLGEAKAGRHWEAIGDVALRLAGDPEDLVLKGAGWVLKVAYEQRPREVVTLLREGPFPRLVLRYAAEKMTARDRTAVLGPAYTKQK